MNERNTVIHTERLVLRQLCDGDRGAMVGLLMNEEIAKTYMIPELGSVAEAERLFLRLKELSQSDERIVYGIAMDGRLIGLINDCGIDGGSVEIGYVIDPLYRGKGYAPEALRAIIDELFRVGYAEAVCGYFEGNDASRRVIEKSGMTPIKREDEIEYRGERHRCFYYSIKK